MVARPRLTGAAPGVEGALYVAWASPPPPRHPHTLHRVPSAFGARAPAPDAVWRAALSGPLVARLALALLVLGLLVRR